jgi:hypothetical protein
MDEHRTVSVSRVYVPNEYTVYLGTQDREQFSGYEESLCSELQEYLAEHARGESYVLLTPPVVLMETDEDLSVGEFGIATRMVQTEQAKLPEGEPAEPVAPGATMIYRPRQAPTEAVSAEELGLEREVFFLTVDGRRQELTQREVVIGRSRDCDVQVPDANVSRRHAEVRQEGATYWLVDLDSTNGTELNGQRTQRAKLSDGDKITVGSTDLVFHQELP